MPITETPLGSTRGHQGQAPTPATAFTLTNADMAVTVWDYGAHLVSVRVPDRDGTVGDIVVGPSALTEADDPNDRRGFRGCTVGRYANRIANSSFVIDGTTYPLAANDGPNHLHGGVIGFDQYVWQSEIVADNAERAAVRFTHRSPDGDEGYPGELVASVTFTLDGDNQLTLSYAAESDAPTVVNLTNHVYWNLASGGPIHDHELRIAAKQFVAADRARIPTNDPITDVAGTRFDFRERRRLGGPHFADGYDDCYVLSPARTSSLAGEVHEPKTGRSLLVTTDAPGVQLYTANHLAEPHSGLCLETQALPDTPNRPEFPSATLRPGERWTSETAFSFTWG